VFTLNFAKKQQFVNYEKQGNIWQLLAVRWKAAKTLTYCILFWRLNALEKG